MKISSGTSYAEVVRIPICEFISDDGILGAKVLRALDERTAYLEGKVEQQSGAISGVREAVVHLEQRVDGRFESIDRRLDTLDRRIDNIDEKISRQFVWTVGIEVTTLAAIVGALLSRG